MSKTIKKVGNIFPSDYETGDVLDPKGISKTLKKGVRDAQNTQIPKIVVDEKPIQKILLSHTKANIKKRIQDADIAWTLDATGSNQGIILKVGKTWEGQSGIVYDVEGLSPTLPSKGTGKTGGNAPIIAVLEPSIKFLFGLGNPRKGLEKDHEEGRSRGFQQPHRVFSSKGLSLTLSGQESQGRYNVLVEESNRILDSNDVFFVKRKRNEYGKKIRKEYESGELSATMKEIREWTATPQKISNTISGVQIDNLIIDEKSRILGWVETDKRLFVYQGDEKYSTVQKTTIDWKNSTKIRKPTDIAGGLRPAAQVKKSEQDNFIILHTNKSNQTTPHEEAMALRSKASHNYQVVVKSALLQSRGLETREDGVSHAVKGAGGGSSKNFVVEKKEPIKVYQELRKGRFRIETEDIVPTLVARMGEGGNNVPCVLDSKKQVGMRNRIYRSKGVSPTLRRSETGGGNAPLIMESVDSKKRMSWWKKQQIRTPYQVNRSLKAGGGSGNMPLILDSQKRILAPRNFKHKAGEGMKNRERVLTDIVPALSSAMSRKSVTTNVPFVVSGATTGNSPTSNGNQTRKQENLSGKDHETTLGRSINDTGTMEPTSMPTSVQSTLTSSPITTFSPRAFLASLSRSRVNGKVSKILVERFSTRFAVLRRLKDLSLYSLRTSGDSSVTMKDLHSKSSSNRWKSWGIGVSGRYLTANIGFRRIGKGSSLSDILEDLVEEKYFLSPRTMTSLLKHKEKHEALGHGFGMQVHYLTLNREWTTEETPTSSHIHSITEEESKNKTL